MRCAVVGHIEWVEFARVPSAARGRRHRARDRELGGAGGRRGSRRAPVGAARRPLRVLHRARRRRDRAARARAGSPSSASTCTSSTAAGVASRRAWTHVDARRRAHDHAAQREAAPAWAAAARRLRRRLLHLRRRRGAAVGPQGAVPRGDAARAPTLREAGVPIDLLVGSLNDPRRAVRRRARRRRRSCRPTAPNGGIANGERFPAVAAAGPGRRHLRRGRLVRRRALLRARARRRAAGRARARGARRCGRDHGAGPVHGAANVGASDRPRLLDLAHAGEGARARARRRDRPARRRPRAATGAST